MIVHFLTANQVH